MKFEPLCAFSFWGSAASLRSVGPRSAGHFLGSDFPTSTMVQVVAFARPELLLEINAIALVPKPSVKDT
jgi:enamine deaminase RidA (YjgF/YER057c/UK114 family)